MTASPHIASIALTLLLAACAAPSPRTLRGETMGTTWSATLLAPARADIAVIQRGIQAELDRVVAQMSTYERDSDLVRFNQATAGSWQVLPPGFFTVLEQALALAADSGGAYDPTVAPLVDLWGFGAGSRSHRIPGEAEIEAARARVGWRRIELDARTRSVRQPGGVSIDLSSIAKGFATDEVGRHLESSGIRDYLVEVGGELRARGLRADGQPWHVAIERPDAAAGAVETADQVERVLLLRDRSIATSGDYRHAFEHEGTRYTHHIDPRSGWPVQHHIASVSTLARDALDADAIGTVVMVLGPDAGLAWAERRGLAVRIVVRDGDGFAERMTRAFAAEAAR
ncbi:MAG: FAD:protein FMN transferase [Lysobacteraceae bacterium]|nr:MAG: FAD:protein FMN transferase [Xanthomonadaceae bacterium]